MWREPSYLSLYQPTWKTLKALGSRLRGNDDAGRGDGAGDGSGAGRDASKLPRSSDARHPAWRGWRRLLTWLRWGTFAFLLSLLLLDFAFPPKLPEARDTSPVVVARVGTPLRAFADAQCGWRYPHAPDAVSAISLERERCVEG